MLAIETLERYWTLAGENVPILIVGGGRWGRVLAGAAVAARGRSDAVALVARSNFPQTQDWQSTSGPLFQELTLGENISRVLDQLAQRSGKPPAYAIVASRPRDHVPDALALVARKIPTLIEKPLSADPTEGEKLQTAAERQQTAIALGVEFSLLPATHFVARALSEQGVAADCVRIAWQDPIEEVRHGAAKRVHEEISLLDDLLPHALSLASAFAAPGDWALLDASLAEGGANGTARLRQAGGFGIELTCGRGAQRVRTADILAAGSVCARIDFSAPVPVFSQFDRPYPSRYSALVSTLRLELGAFLADARAAGPPSPLTHLLGPCLTLQKALRDCLGGATWKANGSRA